MGYASKINSSIILSSRQNKKKLTNKKVNFQLNSSNILTKNVYNESEYQKAMQKKRMQMLQDRQEYQSIWNKKVNQEMELSELSEIEKVKLKSYYKIIKLAQSIDTKIFLNSNISNDALMKLESKFSNINNKLSKVYSQRQLSKPRNYHEKYEKINLKQNYLISSSIPLRLQKIYKFTPYLEDPPEKSQNVINLLKNEKFNKAESKFSIIKLQALVFNEAQKYNKIQLRNKEKFKELEQLNKLIKKDTKIVKLKNPNNLSVKLHEDYINEELKKYNINQKSGNLSKK